jgi:hypothetical protein
MEARRVKNWRSTYIVEKERKGAMEGVLLAAYVGCQSCFNRSDRCIYWPEQGNCLPIFGAFSILLHVHCAPFLDRMFWEGKGAFILGCTSPFKAIMIDRPGMGKVKNWRKSCVHCTKEPEKRSEGKKCKIAPTAHYSDSPLLRQPISPTAHYSVKNGQK